MKKLKPLDFTKMQGKDALEIADALSEDTKAKLVDAAGLILPTKTHSHDRPSRNGLVVALALVAWLDKSRKEKRRR